MLHYSTPKPLSYLQRERNAKAKTEARLADWNDPLKVAVRAVRSLMIAGDNVRNEAARLHEIENAPVLLPPGLRGGTAHPQRVAFLERIIQEQGWSDDPRDPIAPMRTVEEIAAELDGNVAADLDAANARLAALERGEAIEDADPVPAVDTPRGRGRPPKAASFVPIETDD